MKLPDYIASRADWDEEQERQMKAAYRGDPEGFKRAWSRRYPTSVAGAIAELRSRGLNITEDSFPQFCDLDSLERMGRNYILYLDDVERLAETLVEANKITGLALRRKNAGISYAEELVGLRHILHTRREQAAKMIGVGIDHVYAALRVGGIHDPAYKKIDIEEAKAWFAVNADNAEFQHELQLQEVR